LVAQLIATAVTGHGTITGSGVLGADACCSLDPAQFVNTVGWAGETIKDDKIVHILGYQNNVANRRNYTAASAATAGKNPKASTSGKTTSRAGVTAAKRTAKPQAADEGPMGNAMLLPIPSKARMTEANFMDISKYKNLLADMKKVVIVPPKRMAHPAGDSNTRQAEPVQVFSKGMYTVVLAKDAEDIPAALARVPAAKRPRVNKEIFAAYKKWYPGWTFALCCFKDEVDGNDPMIWWYEPMNPHTIFFPALDAHDGHPPKLTEEVRVDHVLIVSSHKNNAWLADTWLSDLKRVPYSSRPPRGTPLGELIPDAVAGRYYETMLPNGDFVFETADVRGGRCNPMRKLPPGAGEVEKETPGVD
jgi:hypothetical protein